MATYDDIAHRVEAFGMVARGGFRPDPDELTGSDARPVRAVVIIGNIGPAMWEHFEAGRTPGPDPLDRWTRHVLGAVAIDVGAEFRHPSDEPYIPMQRWAQRGDTVWPSPIGLLVHPTAGLWHAYRGALLFADDVDGLPSLGDTESPCVSCADQPCLSTCPVDAFGTGVFGVGALTASGYDADGCRRWVRTDDAADSCINGGCRARRSCPITPMNYTATQVAFHMRAFVGIDPAAGDDEAS